MLHAVLTHKNKLMVFGGWILDIFLHSLSVEVNYTLNVISIQILSIHCGESEDIFMIISHQNDSTVF